MDATIAQTSPSTPDSYFYFKITRFNFIPCLIPCHFYIYVHNSCCRIMKQESPIIILVIVSALLFLVHQYLQMVVELNIAFLDNYLDPTALMPLILYAVLWERRILLRHKTMVLPYTDIFGYFILMVVFGEILFPLISERFTADYWDIFAYAFGTFAYVFASEVSNFKKFRNYKSLFSGIFGK
ncbi:MAG: hypothetical protein ABR595_00870 [Psychroflexus sp.]